MSDKDSMGRPHDRELEREADWRWGNTDAHRESRRRTSEYTEAEWATQRAEQDALHAISARLLREGKSPDSAEAKAAAELHRRAISKWFYECSPDMHAMLAEGYVADERFVATYEKIAPGLAEFHAASVKANARDLGVTQGRDDALATLKASMGLDAVPQDLLKVADASPSKAQQKQTKAERAARRRR